MTIFNQILEKIVEEEKEVFTHEFKLDEQEQAKIHVQTAIEAKVVCPIIKEANEASVAVSSCNEPEDHVTNLRQSINN